MVDELSVSQLLDRIRVNQSLSRGPSFESVSAFGPNAALPHYSPSESSRAVIDDSNLYLLDSGGQYLGNILILYPIYTYHFETKVDRIAFKVFAVACY